MICHQPQIDFHLNFREDLLIVYLDHAWLMHGLGIKKCIPCTIKSAWRSYCCQVCNRALGYLSSWPLFALSHHLLVWLAAELVYPGARFQRSALLGDDIVIGDEHVASTYRELMHRLGV